MRIRGQGLDSKFRFSKASDEGWMQSNVDIDSPCFEGAFSCSVHIDELRVLAKVFTELKNSVGTDLEKDWGNMERNIEFTFRLKRLGGLSCLFWFSPNNVEEGPTLSGSFEADQTHIDVWLREAEEVIEYAV